MKSLLFSLISTLAFGFNTPDEAANEVLKQLKNKNDVHAVEYCSVVYKQGAEFFATEFVKGQGNSAVIPFHLLPTNSQFVASVHNHPALGLQGPSVDDIKSTVISSVGTKKTSTGYSNGYFSYLYLSNSNKVIQYKIKTGVRFNEVKKETDCETK